jgi:hypothetical protein
MNFARELKSLTLKHIHFSVLDLLRVRIHVQEVEKLLHLAQLYLVLERECIEKVREFYLFQVWLN